MSKGKKLLEEYKRKLLYFYEVSHVIKDGIDYLQSLEEEIIAKLDAIEDVKDIVNSETIQFKEIPEVINNVLSCIKENLLEG